MQIDITGYWCFTMMAGSMLIGFVIGSRWASKKVFQFFGVDPRSTRLVGKSGEFEFYALDAYKKSGE